MTNNKMCPNTGAGEEQSSQSFRELAQRYYPRFTPETASRYLRRIVEGDPLILGEFLRWGYRKRQRRLKPEQVACITEILGTPSEFIAYTDHHLARRGRRKHHCL